MSLNRDPDSLLTFFRLYSEMADSILAREYTLTMPLFVTEMA